MSKAIILHRVYQKLRTGSLAHYCIHVCVHTRMGTTLQHYTYSIRDTLVATVERDTGSNDTTHLQLSTTLQTAENSEENTHSNTTNLDQQQTFK